MRGAAFLSLLLALPLVAERPPLVVVISVDQFSAELMSRWGESAPGGLGRLAKEGTWFQSAYHGHGFTETGPGHSVILSGRHPAHTGIPENRWRDRSTGAWIYCVNDPASPLLGAPERGASARNFQGSTLGGWLRTQLPGARSFAVTGKDRSAILMAGPQADGVYWFDAKVGFTTSTAYAKALPPWLEQRNARFQERVATGSFHWEALSGHPEDGGSYLVRGKTLRFGLPRFIQGVGMPVDAAFWNRFIMSPFFDQAILETAEALIEHEQLGQGKGTDLLALGLSATDYIGHDLGTTGPEMRDQIRRLDHALGEFLARLRQRSPQAWVVLTADHGCGEFPERLQSLGFPAKRISMAAWMTTLEQKLAARFKNTRPFFLKVDSHQLYLDASALKASGLTRQELLAAAVEAARQDTDVVEACTAADLEALGGNLGGGPVSRTLRERLRLSYVPGRSGDLFLAFKPLVMLDDPNHLCNHGHPVDQDRRVPLIFWGPWAAEHRTEPVRIVDLAPTLAQELGLRPTQPLDGAPLSLKRK